MSDTPENEQPAERTTLAALMLNVAQGPVAEDGTEAIEDQQDASQGDAEAPAAEEQPEPEQATEPTGDEPEVEVPAWPNQEAAGRSFAEANRARKAAEDAANKAAAEAAYWRGLAEGRTPAKQAEAAQAPADDDPEPNPDSYSDDGRYFADLRARDRRQAKKEAVAELAPGVQSMQEFMAQQAWDNSMALAQATAGEAWPQVVAFTNQMRQASPGWEADLNKAANPGAFALNAYRQAVGQPAVATVPQKAAPTQASTPAKPGAPVDAAALVNDPAHQQAVLRAIAAQKAAQGVIPQVPTGPRGVGSGPGAAGAPDLAATVESIRNTSNPNVLKKEQGRVMASWLGGGNGTDD